MITHALIFAAGRGERMRPLTDTTPKPLLAVAGKPLIVWHLQQLARIGVGDVVINTSHLADQFAQTLGDGQRWGLRIRYSYEGPQPLETGGGMLHALPLLGAAPFIAVNGDIWTDYDFAKLPPDPHGLAHLVMVDNPPHHPDGDFVLRNGKLHDTPAAPVHKGEILTFAGIGVYRPELLAGKQPGVFSIVPSLREAMPTNQVGAEHFRGRWTDVGTPQRLAALDTQLRSEH